MTIDIDMLQRYARLLEDNKLSESDKAALIADLRALVSKIESIRRARKILAKYGLQYHGNLF